MNSTNLIISILAQDHPQTLMIVNEKIEAIRKDCLEFTEINLLNTFLRFGRITETEVYKVHWKKSTNQRRDLIAFMLLTFCPERIYGIIDKVPLWGFNTEISGLIGCSKAIISQDMSKVSDYFRIYPNDRERWLKLIEKK